MERKILHRGLHVYPTTGREHTTTANCWCRPAVETKHPQTLEPYGAPLYLHRSMN